MIPHNKEAYEAFNKAVDTFAKEQGIYPRFIEGGLRAEFDMKDEGYTYIFKLIWNPEDPSAKWIIIEGIK